MAIEGIGFDLSRVQERVDIPRLVRERNPLWASVKATEHLGYVDRAFVDLATKLEGEGVPVSPYLFAHADTDPLGQAGLFLRTIEKVDHRGREVIDVEGVYSVTEKRIVDVPRVGAERALENYVLILEKVDRETGYKPLVYTGRGFIASFFLHCSPELIARISAFPLWVAQYPQALPGPDDLPLLPAWWERCEAWQVNGGTLSKTPDGVPIDLNHVFHLPGLLAQPNFLSSAPRWAPGALPDAPCIPSVEEMLDLVSRHGGQEGTGGLCQAA